jgi:hypothetical protein
MSISLATNEVKESGQDPLFPTQRTHLLPDRTADGPHTNGRT